MKRTEERRKGFSGSNACRKRSEGSKANRGRTVGEEESAASGGDRHHVLED